MGSIKVSDMIKTDVKVSQSGKVTGTIKNLSQGVDVPKEGHYFPIQLDKQYYDTELHAGGKVVDGAFAAGMDFTPNESDPYLNTRVESCTDGQKISIYDKNSQEELFSIDFTKATLEPKAGTISASAGTPLMSVPKADTEPLAFTDEETTDETENTQDKHYTKSEINRMSTADLQILAAEKGVENAFEMTGTDLKAILIKMLAN